MYGQIRCAGSICHRTTTPPCHACAVYKYTYWSEASLGSNSCLVHNPPQRKYISDRRVSTPLIRHKNLFRTVSPQCINSHFCILHANQRNIIIWRVYQLSIHLAVSGFFSLICNIKDDICVAGFVLAASQECDFSVPILSCSVFPRSCVKFVVPCACDPKIHVTQEHGNAKPGARTHL